MDTYEEEGRELNAEVVVDLDDVEGDDKLPKREVDEKVVVLDEAAMAEVDVEDVIPPPAVTRTAAQISMLAEVGPMVLFK